MTGRTILLTALLTTALSLSLATPSLAFCGILEEKATARTVKKATRLANHAINRQDRKLRRQHARKYVPDKRTVACVGGAIAIDSNGNEIIGHPSCTVTMAFCVNP